MTQLADHQIRNAIEDGDIIVSPFHKSLIQPASLDLQLGADLTRYRLDGDLRTKPIDPMVGVPEDELERLSLAQGLTYQLEPDEFILGSTLQVITLSARVIARIEGRSTIGRTGMAIHITAGFVDPGFSGQLTLEMKNLNKRPITLTFGMPIAQLSFMRLGMAAQRPYGHEELGSKYQGQLGATGPAVLAKPQFNWLVAEEDGWLLCLRCGEYRCQESPVRTEFLHPTMSAGRYIMEDHQRWYCKAPDPLRGRGVGGPELLDSSNHE